MKLGVLSNDVSLRDCFQDAGMFEEIQMINELAQAAHYEIVVISDRMIAHNAFLAATDHPLPKHQKLFYMLSNHSQATLSNVRTVCEARGIITIPPKLTEMQISDYVIRQLSLRNNTKNNVAVFFGADDKVGTTMVAQSCAEFITQKTGKRVGLLFLGDSFSTHFVQSKTVQGLDDIKMKLWNRILTADELLHSCIQIESLYILPGPNDMLDLRHFGVEDVEYIIKLANELFDVIIIDAGCDVTKPMAIGSLRESTYKYLVTTQQEVSYAAFERMQNQVFKNLQLNTEDFMIIVNKFVRDNAIFTGEQIAEQYGRMTIAGTIPHLDLLGWQAEFDKKTLLQFNNEEYMESIARISQILTNQVGIQYQEEYRMKQSRFGRILQPFRSVKQ